MNGPAQYLEEKNVIDLYYFKVTELSLELALFNVLSKKNYTIA